MVHKQVVANPVRRKNGTRRPPDADGTLVPPATNFQRALPQFLAVGVKNVLLFGYGMTLGFPTIVIPAIQGGEGHHSDITLNREEISWFSSINLLCVPLGCIFSGIFTQPIGKRRAMQFVNLPILAAWLLFHFSTNIYHLYAGLCLAGLMGGLMEAPVLTYVAEVTEPRFRGMLSATGSTCVICGVFTQFLLGSMLKWRTIAAISTVFPLISITALLFVPESPHWLVTKGRYLEAQHALAWLRGWVPISHIQEEYEQIYDILVRIPEAENLQRKSEAPQSYLRQTIGRYGRKSFLMPYALITLTFFIGHFSGKTSLQTYAVQIFHTLKAPIDKYYATVLLGAVEIVGTLVCVVLVHYTGKRPLVLTSLIGCGLCFLGTATYARYLDDLPGGVVENVVANVSAVDFIRDNLIIPDNATATSAENPNEMDEVTDLLDADILGFAGNFTSDETTERTNWTTGTDDGNPFVSLLSNASVLSVIELDSVIVKKAPAADEILLRIPNVAENRYSWVPLTLLLSAAMFTHMGIKLIPWMLIGEVFPASVRSGASGISGGTGYVFGFLANKLFLSMLNVLTMPGTFWLYSAVALIGSIVLYFVLPETEGRTLMDIERHFSGNKSLTSSASLANNDYHDGPPNRQDHIRAPEIVVTPANGHELSEYKPNNARNRSKMSPHNDQSYLEKGEPRTEMTHL